MVGGVFFMVPAFAGAVTVLIVDRGERERKKGKGGTPHGCPEAFGWHVPLG